MKNLSDFPEFQAATEKLASIQAELQKLETEREKVLSEIRATRSQQLEDKAAALLAGGEVNTERLDIQLGEINERLAIHERASHLAAEELEKQRAVASYQICQAAKPELVPHVKTILAALKEIRAANLAICQLRSELEASGVLTGRLPLCQFGAIGTESDHQLHQSPLSRYLGDAKRDFGL